MPADLLANGTARTVVGVIEHLPIAVNAEARICEADVAAVVRRESSPQVSELSTVKMNPQAPGWNKRLRVGAAAPAGRLARLCECF